MSTESLPESQVSPSRADSMSDFEKLKYYRDEIKHEFNLLGMRSTMLVFCQSFLVVPFAILNTAPNFQLVVVAEYLIGALGIFLALLIAEPINAAHRALDNWLIKQRELHNRSEAVRELAIDRDLLPGIRQNPKLDEDHFRSLAFSRFAPGVFIVFWIGALIFCTFRIWASIYGLPPFP